MGSVLQEDGQTMANFGKIIEFIEHSIGEKKHLMVYASWITRELKVGPQGQVYSKRRLSSPNLFSSKYVKGINCIKQAVD